MIFEACADSGEDGGVTRGVAGVAVDATTVSVSGGMKSCVTRGVAGVAVDAPPVSPRFGVAPPEASLLGSRALCGLNSRASWCAFAICSGVITDWRDGNRYMILEL